MIASVTDARNAYNRFAAPGDLEVVRRFVNTRDCEAGVDGFETAEETKRWLEDWGLLKPGVRLSPSELGAVATFRESLRALVRANHSSEPPERRDVEVLDDVLNEATRARLLNGTIAFAPIGDGVTRALGHLVSIVANFMIDGSWERLKVCSNDGCQWAFFDQSRNRTTRWCRMDTCGNRAKARRYRERHGGRAQSREALADDRGGSHLKRTSRR